MDSHYTACEAFIAFLCAILLPLTWAAFVP